MVKGSGKIKITNNKDNKQDSLLNNFLGVKLWLFTIQFREGGGGADPRTAAGTVKLYLSSLDGENFLLKLTYKNVSKLFRFDRWSSSLSF